MAIQQEDITSGAISATRSSNFAVTQTVTYAQSNLTKSLYAIGTVAGMATSDPIAIKDFGTNSATGWADEQDWTIYNQSFTTSIAVSVVSSDTSSYATVTNASISIGDLVGVYGAGSWSTSGAMSNSRTEPVTVGAQNSALVAGGSNSVTYSNTTELFNGSSWSTSLGVLSSAKYSSIAAGSQNAAMIAGGYTGGATDVTELFNGCVWSTSGVLSISKYIAAGAGSQNAALIAGGRTTAFTNATELFNGSVWSTSGVLSAAKQQLAGAGSQSAALVAGGTSIAVTNATELFNGSSWMTSGVLSIAKYIAAAAGSQNAAFLAGGFTATNYTNATELFNGSSWYASGNLSAAKSELRGAGSQSSGLVAGGRTSAGGILSATELHNQTLFRKIVNSQDLKSASNVGVAFDVSSLTLSVKINGYIDNINVTSSNSSITTAAQWVSKWVTLPRFGPNAASTSSVVVKSVIEPEDFVVGYAISRTQMQVFSGNLFSKDRIGGW